MKVETITFNGIRFRRYPGSKKIEHRRYFRPGIGDAKKGIQALHQEVWKSANGAIPPGCHIHHKDSDYNNNTLDNLACLTHAEHAALHGAQPRSPAQVAQWESYRSLASVWHKTPEGRAWHAAHAKQIYVMREPLDYICAWCLSPYQSLSRLPNGKFCSPKCREAERTATGRRKRFPAECQKCGVAFLGDKPGRKYCSHTCYLQTKS